MHDNKTVAFDIKYKDNLLVTIWHVDPCADGDEDSCGYIYKNLNKQQLQWCENYAEFEWQFYFGEEYDAINLISASPFEVIAAIWRNILRNEYPKRHKLSNKDIRNILDCTSYQSDNLVSYVNRSKEDKSEFIHLVRCVYKQFLTSNRQWWQHPKFHINHWKIQIHPVQKFKRWAFSRCGKCNQRFKWGESVYSSGGKTIYHFVCHKDIINERMNTIRVRCVNIN